ncbi:2TM domain-containing protein [Chitinophaga terrae (ex Kim and Jung 2007)]|uniref:2TM domain-containing protein n=1 Tax=Chitinophaga terrae (ex Kim and Jung 2007) TaxID=408074 RepID=A0A1H3XZS8_9BACT|nr:2TM domain-containing protein [Chitinophaga terrae (ex Kim and Jung 2007)]SEA04823.1 2TM domain-containing protein [Chitinophaga terrae (ex Kim and Jung 2007)]
MDINKERDDDQHWRSAKSEAGFKSHLIIYLVVNMGMWLLWFLTDSVHTNGIPWPLWPSLGWGVALAYQNFNAPHRNNLKKAL